MANTEGSWCRNDRKLDEEIETMLYSSGTTPLLRRNDRKLDEEIETHQRVSNGLSRTRGRNDRKLDEEIETSPVSVRHTK